LIPYLRTIICYLQLQLQLQKQLREQQELQQQLQQQQHLQQLQQHFDQQQQQGVTGGDDASALQTLYSQRHMTNDGGDMDPGQTLTLVRMLTFSSQYTPNNNNNKVHLYLTSPIF